MKATGLWKNLGLSVLLSGLTSSSQQGNSDKTRNVDVNILRSIEQIILSLAQACAHRLRDSHTLEEPKYLSQSGFIWCSGLYLCTS